VDRELFEELRKLRRKLARERAVPAYIVFGDATLRDLARKRPSNPGALLLVSGIGMKKMEQYGEEVLEVIRRYCSEKRVRMDSYQ
jgi:ATP-dependent DNA helicase RecQ